MNGTIFRCFWPLLLFFFADNTFAPHVVWKDCIVAHQQVVLVPQGCCLLLRIVKDASNEDHTVRGGANHLGMATVLNQASGIAYTSHDISFISFDPSPTSCEGEASGTKGTLIDSLCSLPTLSRSIVNRSQLEKGGFSHKDTSRYIISWAVLQKRVGWRPAEKIKLWLFWCTLPPIEKRLRSAREEGHWRFSWVQK